MNRELTADDWRHDSDASAIYAPGEWSDEDGKHFDYRYPRVVAHLPDDWEQSRQGPMMAAAPKMLAALKVAADALTPPKNSEEAEALAHINAAIASATGREG